MDLSQSTRFFQSLSQMDRMPARLFPSLRWGICVCYRKYFIGKCGWHSSIDFTHMHIMIHRRGPMLPRSRLFLLCLSSTRAPTHACRTSMMLFKRTDGKRSNLILSRQIICASQGHALYILKHIKVPKLVGNFIWWFNSIALLTQGFKLHEILAEAFLAIASLLFCFLF